MAMALSFILFMCLAGRLIIYASCGEPIPACGACAELCCFIWLFYYCIL